MKEIMADFGIELQLRPESALTMKVAVIGAGVAGLTTAKVLLQAGHEVTVFDQTPGRGRGLERTRRYPGVTDAEPKATVFAVGLPDAEGRYPEWPSGEQVQAYLAGYADELRRGSDAAARTPR